MIGPPARSKSQAPRPKTSNGHHDGLFDVDGRVIDMESQFNELKDMVNSSLTQKKGHDDALELAKTRGTSHDECRLHIANYRSGRTRKRSKNSC